MSEELTDGEKKWIGVSANLILNELCPRLKKHGIEFKDSPIKPEELRVVALMKLAGVLSTHQIRQMMDNLFRSHPGP